MVCLLRTISEEQRQIECQRVRWEPKGPWEPWEAKVFPREPKGPPTAPGPALASLAAVVVVS